MSLPGSEKSHISEKYGIAFDIGTTTLVGALIDLVSGESLCDYSLLNPQTRKGRDVISRITYTRGDRDRIMEMRDTVIHALNDIIFELRRRSDVKKNEIEKFTAVGNPTMINLFTGNDPSSLAYAPYESSFKGDVYIGAQDIGLDAEYPSAVYIPPGIGGHIGSDITAAMVAVDFDMGEQISLLIDIGTNGEIVLNNRGEIFACSAAAGPAFEGGDLTCGMPALAGAIESTGPIKTENDGSFTVDVSTIGDVSPKGICGSGIIDITAGLLNAGLIDRSGRLEADKFILYKDKTASVYVDQKDIREVQLAKAAIAAGTEILSKNSSVEIGDIDRVFISGAFGNHIDRDNSITIGLLPRIDPESITPAGNAALRGASGILCCEDTLRRAKMIAAQTRHIEVASDQRFQEYFITHIDF